MAPKNFARRPYDDAFSILLVTPNIAHYEFIPGQN